uniref:WYL domain-containing protein n=1 Tax=Panagrellus redivivus TaxID=6233 RepID=A0A7E4ULP4_PANRE
MSVFYNNAEDERRSRSVVFKYIRELESDDAEERHQEDYITVIDIIRWLGITDEIDESAVRRTRSGGFIMVTLLSLASKDLLLDRKGWLRTEPRLKDVFIEPAHSLAVIDRRRNTDNRRR